MERRALGRGGLELPVLALGAYAFGGGYWGTQDDRESAATVARALELGIDAVDTAPVYGFGRSEELVGRALAAHPTARVLTKVGLVQEPNGDPLFHQPDPAGQPRAVYADSRPGSLRGQVEASLKRLGRERIDLIQVHMRDPRTPVADTMGALVELRAEGKVDHIGVSNFTVDDLEAARVALGDVPLASDQACLNAIERDLERAHVPWMLRHEVGLLAYSPLAQGLLSGRCGPERVFGEGDGRARNWKFSAANRAAVQAALASAVEPVARAHGATLSQVVLAWTLARPGVTSVLVGMRAPAQVVENAKAAELALTDAERAAIDRAFAQVTLERPRPGLRARLAGLARRLRG